VLRCTEVSPKIDAKGVSFDRLTMSEACLLYPSSLPVTSRASYVGIAAPRDTPVEIIHTLSHEINLALADPKMTTRITELGGAPLSLSPSEFAKLVVEETEKWAEVIKSAGVRAE
jgi:tripartite-type tricarboxylate transporter receptor subunit TctC